MFEWVCNLFTDKKTNTTMAEVIEDEDEGELEIEPEEEPKPKEPKKNGLAKAKKERKPRIVRAPYKGPDVLVSSEKPVPIDTQNKGTKRIARTLTAAFDTNTDTGVLTVTVKKGRGTKDYEYNLVSEADLIDAIKKEMAEAKVNTLDEVRLAVHFPELYWNAANIFDRSTNKIAQMLQEAGIPSGQRRRRGK